ncbi:MMPL family transporter [Solirubrobacter sp. CPCC 204708]|uniref:MMPL family transporter n=1 Tax=Solirubrobacter deserti TaxID=2282478 RepID=A0ABT4RL44_9ACTN|nr:MMPL family transporter [Solirubrobacter deserti]MBE2318986.1 MMPL family transporter [Solirubrobacter deserti]MDA0139289.1 MMPL family transporter [Solirubrobacter deserti]
MNRLSAFVRTRRKLVALGWLVLVVAAVPLMAQQTSNLTSGGFDVPGSGSSEVDRALSRFHHEQGEGLGIVLEDKGEGDLAAAVDRVVAVAKPIEHAEVDPQVAATAKQAAATRDVIVLPLVVDGVADDILQAAKDLRAELKVDEVEDGVQHYVVGQQALWAGMQQLQQEDLEHAELTGFPAILIVLLAVFGTVLAALLPAALAVAAVVVTGAIIYLLSLALTMSVFVTNITSMLGIGVAVDYSLFVLSRYREEVAAGHDQAQALDIAMRTSGATVVFSGVTVIVSLAGLFLLDSTAMRSLAIGAITVVALSVLAAVTLLPALIAWAGPRVEGRGKIVSVTGLLFGQRPSRQFWRRWTAAVMKRSTLSAVGAAAILLALAIPALSLDFGNGALRQFPEGHETRVGFELAAQQIPAGESAPLLVVVDSRSELTGREDALLAYAEQLKGTEGVTRVEGPILSSDNRAVLYKVVPREDPEAPSTTALLDRLRAEGGPSTVGSVQIGGYTGQQEDFNDLVAANLWKIFLFVMICSYLVLLLVLRSVILPLKAVLMNLLTVAAAYGVLVMFFQYGWFDWTGYEARGYVNVVTPPLLLAIVFGLSMDYEVFLLSRIRERYLATGDNRRAVAEGLQGSAKVITSAAVIMVVVFGIFATTGVPQVKEIGLGLAVAIALDATLVRLVLVPATMELMGDWNWWVPKWLEKYLPDADFESDQLADEERTATAVV